MATGLCHMLTGNSDVIVLIRNSSQFIWVMMCETGRVEAGLCDGGDGRGMGYLETCWEEKDYLGDMLLV